ncbi:hypothetical protein SAMN05216480_101227 [Pustulibacterium marinum]|uniref:Lipoprotein n=1 Tax=Pustulibacterium marinum TaxID=1224947 RepID=A0A1I7EUI0_9FLAO|nr:hypothetical protein [Pustulibacterium marinum]SFU27581.1 hypothetical protein SAMN05216480_101227 [Pustulibacterium marinum]
MKMILVKLLSLFILLISTSSCFEVIEEVSLNKNGSGTIELTLNLSQSKTKLASVMLLDSVNGHKIPSKTDIEKHVLDLVNDLKSAPGLSNVKHTIDFDNYILSLRCDFKKVENLNNFAQQVWDKQKVSGQFKSYNYDVSKMLFQRKFDFGNKLKESYSKLSKDDKNVFDNASYTLIYRFENPVKSFSNKNSKLSKSKKALMMKLNANNFIQQNVTIENTIQLIQ